MKITAWCLGLLVCAVDEPSTASALPTEGTFIYSNACESEGGDFGNFRVTITRGPGNVRAVVEFNDEGPDGKASAHNLKFNPATGDLHFSYLGRESSVRHEFNGKVSQEKLEGRFDDYAETLPLIQRLPGKLPACR